MMRRPVRWTLFALAATAFVRFVFFGRGPAALAVFFVAGGLWFWLERRKMRELDAPRPR